MIIYGHKDVDNNGRIKDVVIPFSKKELFEELEVQSRLLLDIVVVVPGMSKNGNIWMSVCMMEYKYSFIYRENF